MSVKMPRSSHSNTWIRATWAASKAGARPLVAAELGQVAEKFACEADRMTSAALMLRCCNRRAGPEQTHSRLAPMIEAAKLIARHLSNVLTYFKHRITNAVAEGLNSKIATVQKRACGYRNPNNFKIAVYFHCGGLNLYPAAVTHTKVG